MQIIWRQWDLRIQISGVYVLKSGNHRDEMQVSDLEQRFSEVVYGKNLPESKAPNIGSITTAIPEVVSNAVASL